MAIRLKDRIEANIRQSDKVNNSLSIQLNSGTATIYDGSARKSINITPATIGAPDFYGSNASGTWSININGYSHVVKYPGPHTEVASGTSPNAVTEGMLYSSGFYMTGTYQDSATPVLYGNIINLAGTGAGQLLCEWSGEDNTPGHLYYRSHRDTTSGGWSPWLTILDSNNFNNYAPTLYGDRATGDWDIHIKGYSRGITQDFSNTLVISKNQGALISAYKDSVINWAMERRGSEKQMGVHYYDTISGAWLEEHVLLDHINYTSYTVTKTGSGASGTWSINISGNAGSSNIANYATFLSVTDASTTTVSRSVWRGSITNGYIVWGQSYRHTALGNDTGDITLWVDGATTLNMSIDGTYYVNGDKPVLHSGNWSSYCAPASHRHSITNISWAGTENLTVTGDNTEWSIDMSGANSYFHIWSGTLGSSCMQFENNTGICRAPHGVYGGVWNDYAEFRDQNEDLISGYIVYSDDDGKLKYTTERLQKFEGVVSDTFGFAIGETDDCKTPLAVSGRVLVYPDPYDHFHSGDCVCAGSGGLAYRMTREEIMMYPDRIVGIVSEIPTYETWGTGNVKIDGRIWIKVR